MDPGGTVLSRAENGKLARNKCQTISASVEGLRRRVAELALSLSFSSILCEPQYTCWFKQTEYWQW